MLGATLKQQIEVAEDAIYVEVTDLGTAFEWKYHTRPSCICGRRELKALSRLHNHKDVRVVDLDGSESGAKKPKSTKRTKDSPAATGAPQHLTLNARPADVLVTEVTNYAFGF